MVSTLLVFMIILFIVNNDHTERLSWLLTLVSKKPTNSTASSSARRSTASSSASRSTASSSASRSTASNSASRSTASSSASRSELSVFGFNLLHHYDFSSGTIESLSDKESNSSTLGWSGNLEFASLDGLMFATIDDRMMTSVDVPMPTSSNFTIQLDYFISSPPTNDISQLDILWGNYELGDYILLSLKVRSDDGFIFINSETRTEGTITSTMCGNLGEDVAPVDAKYTNHASLTKESWEGHHIITVSYNYDQHQTSPQLIAETGYMTLFVDDYQCAKTSIGTPPTFTGNKSSFEIYSDARGETTNSIQQVRMYDGVITTDEFFKNLVMVLKHTFTT